MYGSGRVSRARRREYWRSTVREMKESPFKFGNQATRQLPSSRTLSRTSAKGRTTAFDLNPAKSASAPNRPEAAVPVSAQSGCPGAHTRNVSSWRNRITLPMAAFRVTPASYMPSPRLRPKLQSTLPPGVITPLTCLPSCSSNAGRQGTSWKPSPSSIIAKRPDASVTRCR
jgi:hypothetical protein